MTDIVTVQRQVTVVRENGQTRLVVASQQGPSGAGIPAGGTTGQHLAKASDVNGDAEWVDAEAGGGGASDAVDVAFTPAGSIAADNVQDALEELDSEKADEDHTHSYDALGAATSAVGTHEAAGNPHPTYLTQAEGDAAYDALGAASSAVATHSADTTSVHGITDTSALETTTGSQAKVDAHTGDTSDAHDASAVSFAPTGGVAATDVQAAIAELDTEKEASGTAAAAVSTHAGLTDPHTGYQKESEKGQAGGYASLDGSALVPDNQIPAAIARDAEVTMAIAAEATARDVAIAVAIAALVASAPGVLDTLDEIAAAIGDDPNFAATLATSLAGKQDLDAELTALAGLVSAADRLPYFTGLGAASLATFTTFARTLLDDADASTMRATLGLGTIATQAANSATITGGTITGITDLAVADGGTGASDASGARTNLGLGTSATLNVPASGNAASGEVVKGSDTRLDVAATAHAATSKTTPVDADELPLVDSAASNVLKRLTWANLKATLKTYFDTLYATVAHTHAGSATVHAVCQGRLTLTTAVPVTTSDVTAATTLYFTPFRGNLIGTYSGSAWSVNAFTEQSITLAGLTADKNYDIFIVDSTLALEALVWTNDTTRATALVLQDGVYVKTGATTRRYLGTIRITSAGGACEDSLLRRYVWNVSNRESRPMRVLDTTDSWTYGTNAYRAANNSTANRVQYVVGLSEDPITAAVLASARSTNLIFGNVGLGVDSVTATSADQWSENFLNTAVNADMAAQARYRGWPGLGFHYLQWLERARSGTNMTFYGDAGAGNYSSGLDAAVEG